MSRSLSTVSAVAAVAVIAALGVAGCGSSARQSAPLDVQAPPGPATLVARSGSCVGSWSAGAAGPHTFTVANRTSQPIQVAFIDAATGSIYGQTGQLDPSTSRPMAVDPPAGSYQFRCIPFRGVATVSAVGRITGSGGSKDEALSPLSAEEIVTAVSVYRTGVRRGIHALAVDTSSLTAAVRRSEWSAAKRRWLRAHLDFARLGAAYGTFGDLSDAIDGRPDGLPRGVHDPSFTGFLAVEWLLWHHAPAASTVAATTTLDRDVKQLQDRFPHLSLVPGDLPLRAHEILENALQFELTGDTDEGSHTNLATVLANVQGTALVIAALTPAMELRRPKLLTIINAGLTSLTGDIDATRPSNGRWPNVTTLPQIKRERIDAAIDGLLQNLAQLPGVLTLPVSLALP